MTIIVETGANVTNANSYTSVADADAYHLLYANTDWAGDNDTKEQALVMACRSVDLLYGPYYNSAPLEGVQSLLWPRYAFYDKYAKSRAQSTIPVELKQAQAEIALMYMNGVNIFPMANTQSDVAEESVQIGDIKTQTKYRKPTEQERFESFRKIDLILTPILKLTSNSVSMSR